MPVSSLIDLAGRKLASALAGRPETRLLLASSLGYGFVCQLGDMLTRQKAGKAFMNPDGGAILPPVVLQDSDSEIAIQAQDTRLLVAPLAEIKTLAGGKGVQLMALNPGDSLVSVQAVRGTIPVIGLNARGQKRPVTLTPADLEPYRGHRARKGRAVAAGRG